MQLISNKALCAVLLISILHTIPAYAFSVTIIGNNRQITANVRPASGIVADGSSTQSPGEWSDAVDVSSGLTTASANIDASFVGASGEYALYEISMSGSVSATSYGFIYASTRALTSVGLEFDKAVVYTYTCVDPANAWIDGVFRNCGDTGVLAAGTHSFIIDESVSALSSLGVTNSTTFNSRFVLTSVPVPLPAAVWLFCSGLGLLGWFRRRLYA